MNENRPNPRTATPEKKGPFLSSDSSWGYDMFCGWKQAWLSWGELLSEKGSVKQTSIEFVSDRSGIPIIIHSDAFSLCS